MKQDKNARNAERDKKLAELRKARIEKEAERDSLLKRIEELNLEIETNGHESLSMKNDYAEIHILPAEILSLVFQQACICEERIEIKLSRVCRLWRSISLSSSELWSTFTYCDTLPEVDRLSVYLERSRNQPLDIRLEIPSGCRSAVVDLVGKAIQHVSRWRRFSLVGEWPSDCDLFHPLIDLAAPHLEWFEVFTPDPYSCQDYEYERSRDPFRYIFRGGVPLLSCVRLDSYSMEACMPKYNITTLEIDSVNFDYVFPFNHFLSLFTLPLINLSLLGTTFDLPTTEPRIVTATTLKAFRCGDENVAQNILEYLQAPQLGVLIIRDHMFWPLSSDANDSSLSLFPSLHTLSLVSCDIDCDGFSALLPLARATKSITHLYISHPSHRHHETDLLYSMATNSLQTTLWPHLNTLTYMLEVDPHRSDEDIYVDFEPLLPFFEHHSPNVDSETHYCVFELHPIVAEHWKACHPESWKLLHERGFYREMQPRGKNADQYLPWPSTKFEEIHGASEDLFRISRQINY